MKRSMLFLFLCLPVFLFSQSKLEVLGSLDYSYRTIGNAGIVQSARSTEMPKLNFHFGINYHHQLKEKLWMKIGLGFSKMGYKTEKTEILGGGIDGQGGFDPNLPTGIFIQTKYNFQFLEIPIALRYDFLQNKFKPFIEVGLSTKYYLQSEVVFFRNEEESGSSNERDERVTQIQYAPTLGFGFSYNVNEKWELVMQPNFTYHLTNSSRQSANSSFPNGLVKEHQWSGGLAVGIRMKLK